ncbi:hypothetical protein [Streptosporangium minutum]|uniref:Uncharacterized protein n=1 Tax=Streptosporangium minutum TaxID=569862 RepID=A0A243RP19_9ACTN|nr:hypothetical protein [Streptosporangium minutum]OUC96725.1 hypothetical protein CA984_13865 [Streptosporangium minutum]
MKIRTSALAFCRDDIARIRRERHSAFRGRRISGWVWPRGQDGDNEPHAVDRGDHAAAQRPGEAETALLGVRAWLVRQAATVTFRSAVRLAPPDRAVIDSRNCGTYPITSRI